VQTEGLRNLFLLAKDKISKGFVIQMKLARKAKRIIHKGTRGDSVFPPFGPLMDPHNPLEAAA